MPKFFIISDVHGFYDEMIKALDKAGFDENNPDHWLIGCGDYHDRGRQPLKTMMYLEKLPRKVLVRGNHEQLMEDMCERGFPYSHDVSNGTFATAWQLDPTAPIDPYAIDYDMVLKRLKPFFNQMVNYFETKNYIFVHSWVPLINKDGLPAHYTKNRKFEFNPDWRNASQEDWDEAMWGNPFKQWQEGLNKTGKTIVFGHWHCSTGHSMLTEIKISEFESECKISEFEDDAIWEPFIYDNIIGIDRCTAHTGEVNVLVLEDEFLDSKSNN